MQRAPHARALVTSFWTDDDDPASRAFRASHSGPSEHFKTTSRKTDAMTNCSFLLLLRELSTIKKVKHKREEFIKKYSRRRRRRQRRRRSVFMMAHPRCYYSYALHRLSISLRASERRSGPARPFCCCKVETSSHARGHQRSDRSRAS